MFFPMDRLLSAQIARVGLMKYAATALSAVAARFNSM
jgi:hypothetical protein